MNLMDGAGQRAPVSPARRGFVMSALALAALTLAKPHTAVFAADTNFAGSDFMIVSRLVTDAALDARTGRALHDALSKTPAFDANVQALAHLAAAPGTTIESLAAQLDASKQTALRDTLNKIVSAWYLGIVDNKVYAYQTALMYRPTADVLSVPSYVRAGPLNWAVTNPTTQGT